MSNENFDPDAYMYDAPLGQTLLHNPASPAEIIKTMTGVKLMESIVNESGLSHEDILLMMTQEFEMTENRATCLARYFGNSTQFWYNLDSNYREWKKTSGCN